MQQIDHTKSDHWSPTTCRSRPDQCARNQTRVLTAHLHEAVADPIALLNCEHEISYISCFVYSCRSRTSQIPTGILRPSERTLGRLLTWSKDNVLILQREEILFDKDCYGSRSFPVALNVLIIGELLASQSHVFVIAFLVFADVILLISFVSAISRRDRRYSRFRKNLTPLAEPAIIETAKTVLERFRISRIDIYLTKSDSFRGLLTKICRRLNSNSS